MGKQRRFVVGRHLVGGSYEHLPLSSGIDEGLSVQPPLPLSHRPPLTS
jgi:hypothetical protein